MLSLPDFTHAARLRIHFRGKDETYNNDARPHAAGHAGLR